LAAPAAAAKLIVLRLSLFADPAAAISAAAPAISRSAISR
jgi:hypothetical protein